MDDHFIGAYCVSPILVMKLDSRFILGSYFSCVTARYDDRLRSFAQVLV